MKIESWDCGETYPIERVYSQAIDVVSRLKNIPHRMSIQNMKSPETYPINGAYLLTVNRWIWLQMLPRLL